MSPSPTPTLLRRAREWGLPLPGQTGPLNAITDVPGVRVGYTTLTGVSAAGVPIHTGVTALLPRGHATEPQPVWAGFHRFNGNGEMTGTHWIEDAGYCVGPVCITNTHSVGIVHHAAVRWMVRHHARAWAETPLWAMPVVAETYDGGLSDIEGQHITEAHALAAIEGAQDGPVAEGNVGGGHGMRCYGFKGGTGTASRRVDIDGHPYTLGVLVQANHGTRDDFTVLGVPVGALWPATPPAPAVKELGSIIIVLVTDAPLLPHQLQRLARRAALGFARQGTIGGNSSGDLFLALSTANPRPLPPFSGALLQMTHLNDEVCDTLYRAAVEGTEEAILNAMLAAQALPGIRAWNPGLCPALDGAQLMALLRAQGRVA